MVTFVSATLLVLTISNGSNITMTTTEVGDLKSCHAIGKAWVENNPYQPHLQSRRYECLQHTIYRGK